MQLAIFDLPTRSCPPIDRRYALTTEKLLRQIAPSPEFGGCDYNNPNITLGSLLSRPLPHMRKAIYSSFDHRYIFEVIYHVGQHQCPCIYVKIITAQGCDIGISLIGIMQAQEWNHEVLPLSAIVGDLNWARSMEIIPDDLQMIIDPIYGSDMIDQKVITLLNTDRDSQIHKTVWERWQPLYCHEPILLEALMAGRFIKAPHHAIQHHHSLLSIFPETQKLRSVLHHRLHHRHIQLYYHPAELDEICVQIIRLRVAEFSLTLDFNSALEGHLTTAILNHYYDPYDMMLPLGDIERDEILNCIKRCFFDIMHIYSYMFDVDLYSDQRAIDRGSITVHKSFDDEILIEIRDPTDNRHVGFFTSFVNLAMVTQGVGQYIRHY